jgi:hypothetical protein
MITGMLFVLIIIALAMSVPIIALLIKHQQTMAGIMRSNPESPIIREELAAIRYEVAQLSQAVGSLRAALPSSTTQQIDNDLGSRIGGAR